MVFHEENKNKSNNMFGHNRRQCVEWFKSDYKRHQSVITKATLVLK